ncbi:50S ribosomal protein L18 [Candidatus Pacearchaeota archaeon]|nr:50S ribosomal protein L18 [Candidatus Pacearchaeota archaeon]
MKGIGKTIRRRRKEGKTDYKARLALLSSEKPRLVIRKTNRYILAQIVESNIAQDKVVFAVNSKELLARGWPKELSGSLKSLSAAYLTGKLLGDKAKAKIKEAIIDFGMNRNIKKSRIYAAVKGFIDSGIKVPCSLEVLPTIEELKKDEKTASLMEKIK